MPTFAGHSVQVHKTPPSHTPLPASGALLIEVTPSTCQQPLQLLHAPALRPLLRSLRVQLLLQTVGPCLPDHVGFRLWGLGFNV